MSYHDPNNLLDPCWGLPSLVLHFEGENGSTAIVDNSVNNFTITPVGNAQLSSTQSRFGRTSLSLDGNGDYISTPANTAFAFGTGDLTVEAWVYVVQYNAGTNGSTRILGTLGSVGDFAFEITSAGRLNFFRSGGGGLLGTNTVGTGAWHHIAFTRTGGTVRGFIDGVLSGTVADSFNLVSTQTVVVGAVTPDYPVSSTCFIDEVVVWKGVCRYINNFTPQTIARPGPTYPQPQLLLHMNGNTGSGAAAFVDHSVSNKTVTAINGATTSATQSKFNGSAGSFNGTNQYVQLPASADWNFGTGDLTIEAWVYIAGNSPLDALNRKWATIASVNDTTINSFFEFDISGDSSITGTGFGIGNGQGNGVFYTGAISQNQWHHLAATRQGNTVRLFLDGALVLTNSSYTFSWGNATNLLYVGGRANTNNFNYYFNGFIQELVIWKGFVKYTSDFTPPQQQYSNGVAPSTVLLMHFDGGDQSTIFTDSSTYARAITNTGSPKQVASPALFGPSVGQITTAGSDWLTVAANANWSLANCDFTAECWLRPQTAGFVAVNVGSSSAAWGMQLFAETGTPNFSWSFSNGLGASPDVVARQRVPAPSALSQWYHLVAQRKGTLMELFVDGEKQVQESGTLYVAGGIFSNVISQPLVIGALAPNPSNSPFSGQIDELKITRGVALYDGNFARPTSKYDAYTSTYYGLLASMSPIATWKCNETSGTTAADSTGSDSLTISGSVFNSIALGTFQSNSFTTGATSNAQAPSDYANLFLNANRTFCCWCKIGSSQTPSQPFVYSNFGTYDYGLAYYGATGKFGFTWSDVSLGQGANLLSSGVHNPGDICFVVVTFNSSTNLAQMYVNGVLEASGTGPAPRTTSASAGANFDIGTQDALGANRYFTGQVAAVSVHSIVLTAGQVAALYAAGRS